MFRQGTREACMEPQRILWALGRRAWGRNGSWGHMEGTHGAATGLGVTREACMGHQRILGAQGSRQRVLGAHGSRRELGLHGTEHGDQPN